jgi:hypothetical protein
MPLARTVSIGGLKLKAFAVWHSIRAHCGSPIVRGDARMLNAHIEQLGYHYGIDARLACDGDRLTFSDHHGAVRMKWTRKRA